MASVKDIPKIPRRLEGFRILFVEDQIDNRDLVTHLLKPTGALVDVAADGVQGINKASFQRYDLIIMDLHMPEMDGYTATENLRHRGIMVPIIALTANSQDESRVLASEKGFTEYLLKPIDIELLISTLERFYRDKIERQRPPPPLGR